MVDGQINHQALTAELAIWSKEGRTPRLFLRDDDAVDITPALDRLAKLIAQWNIPLLLAIIPNYATAELAKFVATNPLITPAVHGYAHKNHAPPDEKKIELGDHRPDDIVIGELKTGREILHQMFGTRLSDLLVPPWNRISENVARAALRSGFSGISGFGWSKPSKSRVNTHIDIIDWKNGKANKTIDMITGELATNLAIAREHNWAGVGILTHHLVHDENGWEVLGEFLSLIAMTDDFEWVVANKLKSQ